MENKKPTFSRTDELDTLDEQLRKEALDISNRDLAIQILTTLKKGKPMTSFTIGAELIGGKQLLENTTYMQNPQTEYNSSNETEGIINLGRIEQICEILEIVGDEQGYVTITETQSGFDEVKITPQGSQYLEDTRIMNDNLFSLEDSMEDQQGSMQIRGEYLDFLTETLSREKQARNAVTNKLFNEHNTYGSGLGYSETDKKIETILTKDVKERGYEITATKD